MLFCGVLPTKDGFFDCCIPENVSFLLCFVQFAQRMFSWCGKPQCSSFLFTLFTKNVLLSFLHRYSLFNNFGIQIDKVDSICPHQLYDSKGLFQVYLVRLEDIKEGKNKLPYLNI